jgi:colanic acid/amylovoran biosynthesis glycosyltransferase
MYHTGEALEPRGQPPGTRGAMRIGILIPEFPTQTHVFFWREIVALRRNGVTVDILSTRKPKDGCPHDFGTAAAAETHYLYPPEPRLALAALGGRGLARVGAYIASLTPSSRAKALGFAVCAADLASFARRRGIEHVHVHSCADAAHVTAMSFLLSGLPYSLHLHGDMAVYGTDHRQKMQHAAFVGVAARPLLDQVAEAGVPRHRAFRMIMGVDLSRFEPRAPRASDAGALHLVSVSRLALCKGHVFALEAIRRVIDSGIEVRYSIGGAGSDRTAIEGDVERLGLRDRVTFVGPLSEDGVSTLLKTADVCLLTSVGLGEASPVAVMEAMASGVPAICSRIGGTADMIDSGVDGILVDQEDVTGIADAIQMLARDRSALAHMGAQARKRAEQDFDARSLARSFVANILSTRTPRASETAAQVPST